MISVNGTLFSGTRKRFAAFSVEVKVIGKSRTIYYFSGVSRPQFRIVLGQEAQSRVSSYDCKLNTNLSGMTWLLGTVACHLSILDQHGMLLKFPILKL